MVHTVQLSDTRDTFCFPEVSGLSASTMFSEAMETVRQLCRPRGRRESSSKSSGVAGVARWMYFPTLTDVASGVASSYGAVRDGVRDEARPTRSQKIFRRDPRRARSSSDGPTLRVFGGGSGARGREVSPRGEERESLLGGESPLRRSTSTRGGDRSCPQTSKCVEDVVSKSERKERFGFVRRSGRRALEKGVAQKGTTTTRTQQRPTRTLKGILAIERSSVPTDDLVFSQTPPADGKDLFSAGSTTSSSSTPPSTSSTGAISPPSTVGRPDKRAPMLKHLDKRRFDLLDEISTAVDSLSSGGSSTSDTTDPSVSESELDRTALPGDSARDDDSVEYGSEHGGENHGRLLDDESGAGGAGAGGQHYQSCGESVAGTGEAGDEKEGESRAASLVVHLRRCDDSDDDFMVGSFSRDASAIDDFVRLGRESDSSTDDLVPSESIRDDLVLREDGTIVSSARDSAQDCSAQEQGSSTADEEARGRESPAQGLSVEDAEWARRAREFALASHSSQKEIAVSPPKPLTIFSPAKMSRPAKKIFAGLTEESPPRTPTGAPSTTSFVFEEQVLPPPKQSFVPGGVSRPSQFSLFPAEIEQWGERVKKLPPGLRIGDEELLYDFRSPVAERRSVFPVASAPPVQAYLHPRCVWANDFRGRRVEEEDYARQEAGRQEGRRGRRAGRRMSFGNMQGTGTKGEAPSTTKSSRQLPQLVFTPLYGDEAPPTIWTSAKRVDPPSLSPVKRRTLFDGDSNETFRTPLPFRTPAASSRRTATGRATTKACSPYRKKPLAFPLTGLSPTPVRRRPPAVPPAKKTWKDWLLTSTGAGFFTRLTVGRTRDDNFDCRREEQASPGGGTPPAERRGGPPTPESAYCVEDATPAEFVDEELDLAETEARKLRGLLCRMRSASEDVRDRRREIDEVLGACWFLGNGLVEFFAPSVHDAHDVYQ